MVAVHKLLKKYTKIYLPGCEIDLGATLTRKNLHSEELGETAADKVFNSVSASCINVGVHTCTQYRACKGRHACTSASVLHDVWSYNPLQPYTHFGLPHKIVMLLQLHWHKPCYIAVLRLCTAIQHNIIYSIGHGWLKLQPNKTKKQTNKSKATVCSIRLLCTALYCSSYCSCMPSRC